MTITLCELYRAGDVFLIQFDPDVTRKFIPFRVGAGETDLPPENYTISLYSNSFLKELIVPSCKSSGFIISYVDRLHILLRVPQTLMLLPQLTLSQIVEYLAKSPATYTSPACRQRSLPRFAGLQPTSVRQPLVHEAPREA